MLARRIFTVGRTIEPRFSRWKQAFPRKHSTGCQQSSGFTLRNSLLSTGGEATSRTTFTSGASLTWYSCGPTVYDSSHMGHARTYVCTDIIRRVMVDYFNIRMNYAMGITDIDDKIIKKGRESGLHMWHEMQAMVRSLEDDFFRDMDSLNVLRPDTVLRVTEHIPEIIAYIAHLIELKSAYVTSDGVYFDFSSLKNAYDKFGGAHPGNEEEETVAVPEVNTVDNVASTSFSGSFQSSMQLHSKRSAKDFALWKLLKPSNGDTQECVWASPWGPGRPGWHIECSAMTHSVFGDKIDIHSGGVDLKFPHHTNEIAQCEAHNCSEHNGWVKNWIHLGHLHIEGRKMSKSLKNFVSIEDYLKAGITSNAADDFRLYCLQHKYHATLTYSPARVQDAAKFRSKMEHFSSSLRSAVTLVSSACSSGCSVSGTNVNATTSSSMVSLSRKPTAESAKLSALLRQLQEEVHLALSDDIDTPRVLGALSQLVGESTLYIQLVLASVSAYTGEGLITQPIEPLLAVSAYVYRILTLLGLQFPTKLSPQQLLRTSAIRDCEDSSPSSIVNGTENSVGTGLSDDAIDSILAFRSQIRAAALVGMKAIRAQKKKQPLSALEIQLEENCQQILSQCDAGRESLGRALGVKVDDLTGSASKWTKL